MEFLLNKTQRHSQSRFREFVAGEIAPHARRWDHDQCIPRNILQDCGKAGFTGGIFPAQYHGGDWDTVTFGLLNEAFGGASCSLTGLFTVQSMVGMAILKWGTEAQRCRWLPPIADGQLIAAFALTEPEGGSNIQYIRTRFSKLHDRYTLNGVKKWITFSAMADLFLVFGKLNNEPVAFLVDRNTSGLEVEPIEDLMGFRSAGLATVTFNDCIVPAENMIGRPGFGLSCVATVGLHFGRISTAWSATGLIDACLDTSVRYANRRLVNDRPIASLDPVRNLIADTITSLDASRLLCWQAAQLEDLHDPAAIDRAVVAKLFASRAAVTAADNALHIWGAAGCHSSSPVARFYRDARIMEIIEGTTQICRNMISAHHLAGLAPQEHHINI